LKPGPISGKLKPVDWVTFLDLFPLICVLKSHDFPLRQQLPNDVLPAESDNVLQECEFCNLLANG
jgi:hypothetical protein